MSSTRKRVLPDNFFSFSPLTVHVHCINLCFSLYNVASVFVTKVKKCCSVLKCNIWWTVERLRGREKERQGLFAETDGWIRAVADGTYEHTLKEKRKRLITDFKNFKSSSSFALFRFRFNFFLMLSKVRERKCGANTKMSMCVCVLLLMTMKTRCRGKGGEREIGREREMLVSSRITC